MEPPSYLKNGAVQEGSKVIAGWMNHVKCGLLSAKGGLMMGTKKGGGFLQPAKESQYHYNRKKALVKKKNKNLKFYKITSFRIITEPLKRQSYRVCVQV